ncbi:MAG: bifunctional [glutamine synthetase] adenylyltransferase/[glutamine synthetase]-adenylyl-L-tyrosine phosphorylase [Actinomycetota bacterium]
MSSDLGQRRAETLINGSKTLGEMVTVDAAAGLLDDDGPLPDRTVYASVAVEAVAAGGLGALRGEKRRRLAQIAARDLCGEITLEEVGLALADLADACLAATLDALDAPEGLAIIAMGKLGGRELNYASDIDIVFVAEGDLGASTKAAESLLRELGDVSPQGQAYRIDTNLRPEGRSGALVRSLEGCLEYYKRWAQHWEHQALIKARAAAGNYSISETLVTETRPLVFPNELPPERVADIRKMKVRVEEHAARAAVRKRTSSGDDVKLGPGGIRDIEFSVQLLQLVHGGSDLSVRDANTLNALAALVDGGYVAEDDGAGLAVAYRWLRAVEHRLQLWQERQVHTLPTDQDALTRLARTMGFEDSPAASAAARFDKAHRAVIADVRSRFEKLVYRPMIESLAESEGPRLSSAALKERLRVLGFRDVERAAQTLSGLVAGTSRRARLFRVLTPALLRFLAATPMPDEGLFSFLRLGEALSGRLDALGALRDNPPGLEFLARVLGSGRLLGEVLLHVPEEIATIADLKGPGEPKERERLVHEAIASLQWREPEDRLSGLRRFKRREMLRVALADLAGAADVAIVGAGLSHLADACLEAALQECTIPFAVIGMGKLGGLELNYASDIDVMFVHDADPSSADKVAEELMKAIGEVTPEGQAFRIDPALRPEGKSGPLVRSLDSYVEYYGRWSDPWEHLALIKARFSAGDRSLGEQLVARAKARAFPERVSPEARTEIRHLKARMERERIPRGTDPRRHLKLGPGGLSDVEFAIQMLQMEHGAETPELQVTPTLDALDAAQKAGLIGEEDARRLTDAYILLTRARNALFLMIGRPTDALPTRPEDLDALGIALGFTSDPRQEVEEEYLRVTRRARRVAEPLIYG